MNTIVRATLGVSILFTGMLRCDWPVYRGDALMSGVGQAKLPKELEERWTFSTDGSLEGTPAIADGIVYVGSHDKHLYALDLATGKLRWKKLLGPIKAPASVRGERVYVGTAEGSFYSLSTTDGRVLWTFKTGGEIAGGCNFHGDHILIGSHDRSLYCLDASGKKLWEVKTEGPINGTPAVSGDFIVIAGCDNHLHIIDAKQGKELDTIPIQGQAAASAALKDNIAYIATMANQVIAVDWKNSKKIWTFEGSRRPRPFYASVVATPSFIIAGGRDRRIYALDPKTGREHWNYITDGQIDSSPVVVGGRVYVGCLSREQNFLVLDLQTGRKLQELELDAPITSSIAVGTDCLLVGTDRGTLYCLGAK